MWPVEAVDAAAYVNVFDVMNNPMGRMRILGVIASVFRRKVNRDMRPSATCSLEASHAADMMSEDGKETTVVHHEGQ